MVRGRRARSEKASGVAGTSVGRKSKQHALQTFPPGKDGKKLDCPVWKIWGPTAANLKCRGCEGNGKPENKIAPVRGAFGKRCLAAAGRTEGPQAGVEGGAWITPARKAVLLQARCSPGRPRATGGPRELRTCLAGTGARLPQGQRGHARVLNTQYNMHMMQYRMVHPKPI